MALMQCGLLRYPFSPTSTNSSCTPSSPWAPRTSPLSPWRVHPLRKCAVTQPCYPIAASPSTVSNNQWTRRHKPIPPPRPPRPPCQTSPNSAPCLQPATL
ncbi:hypothetical protein EMPG_17545 [Blastomyces silverae]|uniref:Uncharacterized protein n=1 Tax=Blastomyces silverae TaxID=2060906 RepID=A0A0H1B7H2_9EURO|nr:hypothetical protein EMPG_17545 [Blastomyces silverae]